MIQVSDSKQKTKQSVWVDEDLARRIRIKAAPRGLAFQQVAIEAIDLWLSRPSGPPPSGDPTKEEIAHGLEVLRFLKADHEDPLISLACEGVLRSVERSR